MIDLSEWYDTSKVLDPLVRLASNNVSYKDLYNWWEIGDFGHYLFLSTYHSTQIPTPRDVSMRVLRRWSNRWDYISIHMPESQQIHHTKIASFQPNLGATSFIFKLPESIILKAKIVMGDRLCVITEEEFDLAIDRSRRK